MAAAAPGAGAGAGAGAPPAAAGAAAGAVAAHMGGPLTAAAALAHARRAVGLTQLLPANATVHTALQAARRTVESMSGRHLIKVGRGVGFIVSAAIRLRRRGENCPATGLCAAHHLRAHLAASAGPCPHAAAAQVHRCQPLVNPLAHALPACPCACRCRAGRACRRSCSSTGWFTPPPPWCPAMAPSFCSSESESSTCLVCMAAPLRYPLARFAWQQLGLHGSTLGAAISRRKQGVEALKLPLPWSDRAHETGCGTGIARGSADGVLVCTCLHPDASNCCSDTMK